MFGCELPVAAKKFPALPELVVNNHNGMLFDTADELSNCIQQWFHHFPNNEYQERNRGFVENVKKFKRQSWKEHWSEVAKPFFS